MTVEASATAVDWALRQTIAPSDTKFVLVTLAAALSGLAGLHLPGGMGVRKTDGLMDALARTTGLERPQVDEAMRALADAGLLAALVEHF